MDKPSSELIIVDQYSQEEITEQDAVAMIPSEIRHKVPESLFDVIENFYDGPDGDVPKIIDILTRGYYYHPQHPEYEQIRLSQARDIQEHLVRLTVAIRVNKYFLGYLLAWIIDTGLYQEMGYPSLEEMCISFNIDGHTRTEVIAMVSVQPFLRRVMGIGLIDFMHGDFADPIKLKQLQGWAAKEAKQVEAIKQDVLQEKKLFPVSINTDSSDESGDAPAKKPATITPTKVLLKLPQEQKDMVIQEVQERYQEAMSQKIEHLRALKPGDVLAERKERAGQPEPPLITLEFERRGNTIMFSGGLFACEAPQIAAMLKNQATYRYKDRNDRQGTLLTLRQLGEILDMEEFNEEDECGF